MIRSVRIVGSGLIGTSIGLCMKAAGATVEVVDLDINNAKLAQDLIKSSSIAQPELIVVAVPISANQEMVIQLLNANRNSIVCDLASVKSDLLLKVKELSDQSANFISLHPMAGREVSGAENARADLFKGRAWIAISDESMSEKAREIGADLVAMCGSTLYWMSSLEHDQTVAKISHLPQILSSLLAGALLDIPSDNLNLSGQGLRDLTRLANSDSKLWSEIFLINREVISPLLDEIINDLQSLKSSLNKNDKQVFEFMEKGNRGKNKIPGKHGEKARDYSYLPIVIDDKPGELARIFNECANISVNIEDLSIEHSPGQETGLITLALSDADCVKLSAHLGNLGFKVHQGKNR